MEVLLHPTYLPNIAHFVSIVNAEKLVFEVEDNYQKQTYRNRTYIYGANGKLALQIPVNFTQKNRQLYKDVRIANNEKWQANHLKSLQSAYRTSPFFEYYEDELIPLFSNHYDFLLDFNFKCLEAISECLQLDLNYEVTQTFEKEVKEVSDLRYLVNIRKEQPISFDEYIQVFSEKHGFISNLSILDLLFYEGPNALTYLEVQRFPFNE
jgi:hypothetical protein